MKTTFELVLNSTFYAHATTHNFENGADLSIHEFFRNEFVRTHFMTYDLQQNGVTGVYSITVESSTKDSAALPVLIAKFCHKMYLAGVSVEGYVPESIKVTLWVDMDEHTYHANINDGAVPDCECATFDELQQWVNGFKLGAEMQGAVVLVVDETE